MTTASSRSRRHTGSEHRILSWAGTVVFLPAFVLTLLVFDVAQRIARLFGQRPQEYVAGAVQVALVWCFKLGNCHVDVERSRKLHDWTSYVVISNHQSMFDIALIGAVLFKNFPKYISKRSLGKWIPTVSYNLREGGHVLIDRSDGAAAVQAIRTLGRRVAAGGPSAVIFPEGTRARHGELGKFKPAGSVALMEEAPKVAVVPMAIDESWRLLQRNFLPLPWGVRVRVWIGDPIHRKPDQDPIEFLDSVRGKIQDRLTRWRQEDARLS